MDGFARECLARVPLAEAVLWVWRWIADEGYLREVFDRHRGRSYDKILSFPTMVRLVADAIVHHGGSGRRSFERAAQCGELDASIQATFKKLGRLPVPLSMGFLAECTQRLEEIFPDVTAVQMPPSLHDFRAVVLDGKAIKRVAKRLKPLRGTPGGVVGGRALVALCLPQGLVMAMYADPDGDANEVRFLPEFLPQLRSLIDGQRLWVGDRAFCPPAQIDQFDTDTEHFLIRYRSDIRFEIDDSVPPRQGRDGQGRAYVEQWGWLGTVRQPKRHYVRRVTLKRPGEEDVTVVSSLLDAEQYPATDLLELYLSRWGIERVFQEVTKVFGLQRLIGSSPRATIFQFAFCLVLYNIIQLVRGYIAVGQHRSPATISTEKLFVDVQMQLAAWTVFIPPTATVAYLDEPCTAGSLGKRLRELLESNWSDVWIKSPPRKRKPKKPQKRSKGQVRTHRSAYRLIQEATGDRD
jgi:hypothetical protein